MHTFAQAAVLGLSCLSLVSTGPIPDKQGSPPSPADSVFSFPLPNGFPNVKAPSPELSAIEQQAHGTLPNTPPPPTLAADDATSFQLVAFNEISEVAFFTELLHNVTEGVTGYTFTDATYKQTVIDAITAIQAQEELHALNANTALEHFGAAPIQPCKYSFPVSDFSSALALATTFTDLVLGTLGDIQYLLGVNGDPALIPLVASVIGQEGEQVGFFRSGLGKIPSALPFLTGAARQFAFSALNQNFVVPGSCPNSDTIKLPIFAPLLLNSPMPDGSGDVTLEMTFTLPHGAESCSGYNLVYINQQNLPIVEALQNVQQNGDVVTFSVPFPYVENLLNGLTIAAVASGSGFVTPEDVAKATIAGPALIEVK